MFSIIRLPFLVNLGVTDNPTCALCLNPLNPANQANKNLQYLAGEYVEVTIWSIWETELGMICASMPALRHLFKKVWPNVMRTIIATLSNSSTVEASGYGRSTGASGRDKERSRTGNKDYYELDETSLIGKGAGGGTTNSSVTAFPA